MSSRRLAQILTEEIWPPWPVRLPLWLRVAAWLGCVPMGCLLGVLLVRAYAIGGPVREWMVFLAVCYPPLAVLMLMVKLAFKRATRR
jgi:hypothetical protein